MRATASQTLSNALRLAAILCTAGMLTGCLSYQRQADQLFEEGRCSEALPLYESAFKNGLQSSSAYHRSARCALKLGEFSTAERYYSQSLRHGGGLEVATELADFYVKTNNFTSAVRVFQFLLYRTDDKQRVYNNLGTALMYADQPFDAESYLLVAQQLDPADPSPYLNLGVLYDRHLKQPWLAINFYDCFTEMAQRADNASLVRQRTSELKQRWVKLYEADALVCGKVYEPAAPRPVADLKAAFPVEAEPIQVLEPAETDGDVSPGKPVVVEQMIKTADSGADTTSPQAPEATSDAESLSLGARAYKAGQWAEAVARLSSVPISKLGAVQFEMLGLAYLKQNNWSRAKHWLELAVEEDPRPETVEALAAAHTAAGDQWRVRSVCKKYGNLPQYERMRERFCTQPTDADKR